MRKKPSTRRPANVRKIIPSVAPGVPEKAEIAIDGCDELYSEIRIANALQDEKGQQVKMKPGADVEVTIEADTNATISAEAAKPARKDE
jgi:hypothetical protein